MNFFMLTYQKTARIAIWTVFLASLVFFVLFRYLDGSTPSFLTSTLIIPVFMTLAIVIGFTKQQ